MIADGTTITTSPYSTTTLTTTTTTTTTSSVTAVTTAAAAAVNDGSCTAAAVVTPGSCDLDTSVDEISVENVPRREEGFFHRLLSRRSTKKKITAKSTSAEDVDVDRFLFDETMGAKPRQREEPPPAGRMQLSYPPDLPPDHQPHGGGLVSSQPLAEELFESDTFAPIKQSFSLGQQTVVSTTDEDATSSGGGSSVQKSSSSDSVSSTALDEPTVGVESAVPATAERCRSYSSSDSEHHVNGHHVQRAPPVPAPRLSKLYNGGGGGGGGGAPVDVVVRRRKRDDQQPELLKVFARRSLKLGKDGEPELLLVAGDCADDGGGGSSSGDGVKEDYKECAVDEVAVPGENDVVVVVVDKKPEVDVNENQTPAVTAPIEVVPRFKRIQQRREEWEKRFLQQQRN